MESQLLIVGALVLLALAFDYINGFHDAANSIAKVVSTRVLSPGQAVIWAAFWNFAAIVVFGTAVAKTMGSGLVDLGIVTFAVIGAGLTGAILWDLFTWYYGLPTSSSHALFGGHAGAAVAKAGFSAIIVAGWKKHIQQELSKKFENPTFTVRDYFEYLKRGIDETGSFDANMKKAQKYYPSRSVDKLKNSYRRTKSFNVLEEPRIVSQKDENAVVVAKVKQTEVIKKDGKDQEVTRVLTVTYSRTANKEGQWVIKSSTVKIE